MIEQIVKLFIAFVLLWLGSGIAVNTITKIASRLHASSFYVSFLLLGVLTSLTEIVVGASAFITNQPEVYIGNLLGSSMVVFLFVAPILAILGNGISLNHTFSFNNLRLATFVVGIPAVMTLDNNITVIEGLVMIMVYAFLLFALRNPRSSTFATSVMSIKKKTKTAIYFAKSIIAILFIIVGANLLIEQTIYFGSFFNVPTFIVSLVLISIGTNIPELSIGIRAILAKKKGVAFGNYIGSAAFNTLQLGILSVLYGKTTPANGSNYSVLIYVAGLLCFMYYAKSKNQLSRNEGVILFALYALLVFCEFVTGPGWNLRV